MASRPRRLWQISGSLALSIACGLWLRASHANESRSDSAPRQRSTPASEASKPVLGATRRTPAAARQALADGPAIRGITIGPIESALHPGRGYASPAYQQLLREILRWGANWVSLTPFGRVWDKRATRISPVFEAPYVENRDRVRAAVEQAHALGLRVLLVPHLWVESGEWRGELDPGSDSAWAEWSRSYQRFVIGWAEVAEQSGADMLAVGVELRSWLTTARAASFLQIIQAIRATYSGLLTYGGNWDDIADTVILGELDVIGVNAFYPLAEREDESAEQLLAGGRRVAAELRKLAEHWQRPVILSEFGYTTRPNPALRPWEWPDGMRGVVADEAAQAAAYAALLKPLLDEPSLGGAFLWRLYADPDDMSQEAAWGFSPRGKQAELVLRDAFAAHWARDGKPAPGAVFTRLRARVPGFF